MAPARTAINWHALLGLRARTVVRLAEHDDARDLQTTAESGRDLHHQRSPRMSRTMRLRRRRLSRTVRRVLRFGLTSKRRQPDRRPERLGRLAHARLPQ